MSSPGRRSMCVPHIPVLPGPVIEWLQVRPGGVYLDCTVGAGGHSEMIAQRLSGGRLVALDRDPAAVALAHARLASFDNVTVHHHNYGGLSSLLHTLGIHRVDGILLDAGLSSMQLDDSERGFSFQAEGPLDMRMDSQQATDAAGFLARVSFSELEHVLRDFGDLRPAKRIAKAILVRRGAGQLNTTRDLADAVCEALPFVTGTPEEIRTVFQAIRIAVNEELRWLEAGIAQGIDSLAPGGRFVVIAFHSGEDRIVKNLFRAASRPFREQTATGRTERLIPPAVRVLTPKPVRPDRAEVERNPRAASARLRVVERLSDREGEQ